MFCQVVHLVKTVQQSRFGWFKKIDSNKKDNFSDVQYSMSVYNDKKKMNNYHKVCST